MIGDYVIPLTYTQAEREYAQADRAEKTQAISAARVAMIEMEALIEGVINRDPPPFTPQDAHSIRDEFKELSYAIDKTVDLLAQDRDEFSELNTRVAFLVRRVDELTKARDDAQSKVTEHFNAKLVAERELQRLRLRDEGIEVEPDCG